MNRYVVAFVSFHYNKLTQRIIEADSEFEAGKLVLGNYAWGDEENLEQLKVSASDNDCRISILKI